MITGVNRYKPEIKPSVKQLIIPGSTYPYTDTPTSCTIQPIDKKRVATGYESSRNATVDVEAINLQTDHGKNVLHQRVVLPGVTERNYLSIDERHAYDSTEAVLGLDCALSIRRLQHPSAHLTAMLRHGIDGKRQSILDPRRENEPQQQKQVAEFMTEIDMLAHLWGLPTPETHIVRSDLHMDVDTTNERILAFHATNPNVWVSENTSEKPLFTHPKEIETKYKQVVIGGFRFIALVTGFVSQDYAKKFVPQSIKVLMTEQEVKTYDASQKTTFTPLQQLNNWMRDSKDPYVNSTKFVLLNKDKLVLANTWGIHTNHPNFHNFSRHIRFKNMRRSPILTCNVEPGTHLTFEDMESDTFVFLDPRGFDHLKGLGQQILGYKPKPDPNSPRSITTHHYINKTFDSNTQEGTTRGVIVVHSPIIIAQIKEIDGEPTLTTYLIKPVNTS